MFLQSLVKLHNDISVWNFVPKFRSRPNKKKKVFAAFWFYLNRNVGFLAANWVLLTRKLRGPDIFRPLQC